jgi:hypothetical protein
MRIALCLTGQIRSHDLVKDSWKEHLLEPYNPDVFCHFSHKYDNSKFVNFYNSNCTLQYGSYSNKKIDDVINFFRPTSLKYSFPFFNENTKSMLYSIAESNKLKIEHEKNTGIEYDVVIKSRYDIRFQKKFDIQSIEDNTIYLTNRPGSCNGYGDWIAYGNSKSMDFYMNCFYAYENTDRILQLCPEGIWKEYLDRNNFKIKYIEKSFNVIREDGYIAV